MISNLDLKENLTINKTFVFVLHHSIYHGESSRCTFYNQSVCSN